MGVKGLVMSKGTTIMLFFQGVKCPSARRLPKVQEDTEAPSECAICAEITANEAVGFTCAFLTMWWSFRRLVCSSLDIFGHWNAKRSSVPYLMYWALDVGLACFRDGVSLLVDMEGDSGRGELLVTAVIEKSSPNSCKQTRSSSAIGRQESKWLNFKMNLKSSEINRVTTGTNPIKVNS
ncbi:hypothetical protein TNCV_4048951 [Trichonephila clavipes]|nr:hypothetical protein TNCV_4048951 [Trichonephila clavipes]